MNEVVGIHLICRTRSNNKLNADGTYSCRAWKIDSRHLKTAVYVALHEEKRSSSYLQGALCGAHPDAIRPERWVLVVRPDDQPRSWKGGGTGEKGYLRRGQ